MQNAHARDLPSAKRFANAQERVWHLENHVPKAFDRVWHLENRVPKGFERLWHLENRVPKGFERVWHLENRVPNPSLFLSPALGAPHALDGVGVHAVFPAVSAAAAQPPHFSSIIAQVSDSSQFPTPPEPDASSSMDRREAALLRAREASLTSRRAPAPGVPRRWVAVGDPQAPSRQFFAVLEQHGLLTQDGWLDPEVHLVAMGDYFDFGGADARDRRAEEGVRNLSWLAAHDPAQVSLIVGNHDLARVGELMTFDDARFARAHVEATRLYRAERILAQDELQEEERSFFATYPEAATTEVMARDFCSFTEKQRNLVMGLLDSRRLRLAYSIHGLLLCHAGVTTQDLSLCATSNVSDPDVIAAALNEALDRAYQLWDRASPFRIPSLHVPGSFAGGEGAGILFHRPAHPGIENAQQKPGRRYDPCDLPPGITQVVGHVRDNKCRKLFGTWVQDATPEQEGQLRSLHTDGERAWYQLGIPSYPREHAALIFTDSGMNYVPSTQYQLLDLVSRQAIKL